MSECRDLAFHVQEHHFTCSQIDDVLQTLGLRIIKLDASPEQLSKYRSAFQKDSAAISLQRWAQLEEKNPDLFAGMIQFWVQKDG